jgi:imidazolonepropionase-like amidohydrolase
MSFLFKNLRLLDPRWKEARAGYEVLIEGDTIKEVSAKPIKASKANVIDCGKRTLMPGLIDCHVHTHHSEVYINRMEAVPLTLMMARSTGRLKRMLDRGFTTVRDAGGADWGTKTAVDSGLIPGPRMFISCRSISPTGGHSDRTRRTDTVGPPCLCCNGMVFIRYLADGADAVRKGVREQMRQGADQIKLMVSGGVASPYDPLESLQFTEEEITAAVEEAHAFGRYVLTHAYTPEAIQRAVKCGVRTIEHGNLVDAPTAALMAQMGAYAVPTLVTYDALANEGESFGLPKESVAKVADVREAGLRSLGIYKAAGVKMGFGSDLLGESQRLQSDEFRLRAEVLSPAEAVASATVIGAEVLGMPDRLGRLVPGALADILVVDGNPLRDVSCLLGQGERIPLVMKEGAIQFNELE